jgi:hypothetical protein
LAKKSANHWVKPLHHNAPTRAKVFVHDNRAVEKTKVNWLDLLSISGQAAALTIHASPLLSIAH